jgi:hypothetical protein
LTWKEFQLRETLEFDLEIHLREILEVDLEKISTEGILEVDLKRISTEGNIRGWPGKNINWGKH